MVVRAPATVVIGAIAVALVSAASLTIGWHASRATIDAGFGWEPPPFVLSAGDEEAHQALGPDNVTHIDNRADEHSYEYGNADRPSQYYGDLRWTTAWPVLEAKFGK